MHQPPASAAGSTVFGALQAAVLLCCKALFCAFPRQNSGKARYAERLAALHSEIPVIANSEVFPKKSEIGDHNHEKWQENRNYRKIRDDSGEVVAHIITVDGRDVAVTEDVFAAYAQMDRRERYLSEDLPTGKVLSMEQLAEDGVLPDYVGAETAPSAEDCVLARESEREREELTSLLLAALISLEDRDRQLITALFYDHLSTREYARRIGVTQRAVIKRRDRILRDMKKYFEKFAA